ncbi:MAG: AAA family ATPase, partial [Acetatifactor sp.]|nr:AAA family ATPase [Acetatifactor sp.]
MASKYPFKRDFYEDVVKCIQENGATFVLGPRRCGKTVCLLQVNDAYENAEYGDFKKLNTEQQGMEVLSRIQKSIEDDEDKIYLLDEMTYAPLPEKYICEIAYLFTAN